MIYRSARVAAVTGERPSEREIYGVRSGRAMRLSSRTDEMLPSVSVRSRPEEARARVMDSVSVHCAERENDRWISSFFPPARAPSGSVRSACLFRREGGERRA